MKVIKASYELMSEPNWDDILVDLERCIRTCYKSERKMDKNTSDKLIRSIISRGHESTLEHKSMTVKFIADRGFLAEITRHRHCSFSVESTRYVNYSPDSKNNQGDMKFILPCWMDNSFLGDWDESESLEFVQDPHSDVEVTSTPESNWIDACVTSQKYYNTLIDQGWNPEHSRTVLPNSLKTEIVMTTNIRDWRHLLALRCDKTAHPQMRELMVPLLDTLIDRCPTLFDSIEYEHEDWTVIKQRETKVGTKSNGE